MIEKYKLGLSSNRLYEMCNKVAFCAEYKEKFDVSEAKKAFAMLCEKEPVINMVAEYEKGNDCFLVERKSKVELLFTEKTSEEVMVSADETMDSTQALFEFYLTSDNCLVIFGNTLMSDGKSLLRLAKSFVLFYEKKMLSIEPELINTFSDATSLPVDIASPLTDKLSANLDEKWNKRPVLCEINDYKKAVNEYKNIKSPVGRSGLFWIRTCSLG